MVMRTEKWLVLCVVLLLIQLVACERSKMEENGPTPVSARTGTDSADASEGKPYIVTEKTTGIKLKEPSTFTFVGGKSAFVVWRSVPALQLESQGTKAIIYFQNPGKHRILAVDSLGHDTTYIDVEVIDQPYQMPVSEKPILANDVLSVTPIAYGDTVDNLIGLEFVTAQTYPCTQNHLSGKITKGANSYEVKFGKTLTGVHCYTAEQSPGTSHLSVNQIPANFDGVLEIEFNDKIYKGTMKRTGQNTFEFNWPHATGVVFTKKSL
jgi:hypothetical protein